MPLCFSPRSAELHTLMGNSLITNVRPAPKQIHDYARFLKIDLKVCLTIGRMSTAAQKPLISNSLEELSRIFTSLETNIYHIRDILVGLSRGLNNSAPEELEEVEIPLEDLVRLTREYDEPKSRTAFVEGKALDLLAFYHMKQRITALADSGTNLTWGIWGNLGTDMDTYGVDIFQAMADYAGRARSSLADMEAALALLGPELRDGIRELPARLRELL